MFTHGGSGVLADGVGLFLAWAGILCSVSRSRTPLVGDEPVPCDSVGRLLPGHSSHSKATVTGRRSYW